jgi:hypothetical protein
LADSIGVIASSLARNHSDRQHFMSRFMSREMQRENPSTPQCPSVRRGLIGGPLKPRHGGHRLRRRLVLPSVASRLGGGRAHRAVSGSGVDALTLHASERRLDCGISSCWLKGAPGAGALACRSPAGMSS